jgi:hypothetical protein
LSLVSRGRRMRCWLVGFSASSSSSVCRASVSQLVPPRLAQDWWESRFGLRGQGALCVKRNVQSSLCKLRYRRSKGGCVSVKATAPEYYEGDDSRSWMEGGRWAVPCGWPCPVQASCRFAPHLRAPTPLSAALHNILALQTELDVFVLGTRRLITSLRNATRPNTAQASQNPGSAKDV